MIETRFLDEIRRLLSCDNSKEVATLVCDLFGPCVFLLMHSTMFFRHLASLPV
eukprot:m.328554 g.328554  ORF g.328554 m.328554 type:complete len:53 (+) comp55591_c0_seq8:104-262(+)